MIRTALMLIAAVPAEHQEEGQGHHDKTQAEELPGTYLLSFAPQRREPKNGGERAGDGESRSEVDADQQGPGHLVRHFSYRSRFLFGLYSQAGLAFGCLATALS